MLGNIKDSAGDTLDRARDLGARRGAGIALGVLLLAVMLISVGRMTAPVAERITIQTGDLAGAELTLREALTWGLDARNVVSPDYEPGLEARHLTSAAAGGLAGLMNSAEAQAAYGRMGGQMMLVGAESGFRGLPVLITRTGGTEAAPTFEVWTVFIAASAMDQAANQTWSTFQAKVELLDGTWTVTDLGNTPGPTPGGLTSAPSTVKELATRLAGGAS